jgi:hypothetical protein
VGQSAQGHPLSYFEFDILPMVKNKRNATTAITIKNNGLSRMPIEYRSYCVAQVFGYRPEPHDYIVITLHRRRGHAGRVEGPQNASKLGEQRRRNSGANAVARRGLPV